MKKLLLALTFLLLSVSASNKLYAAGAAGQPSICSRSCWAARSAGLNTNMATLNRAIIHHTAGSGDYNVSSLSQSKAKVRAVQNLHMDANGWSDVGYHFLFDKLGNAFEGRRDSLNKSVQRRGAHDGTNTNSFGFSNLGYYHSPYNHSLTTAQKNKLYDVIAWRMPNGWSPYGAGTYNGKTVGYLDGHRDVKSTSCPGDKIYNTIIGTNHNAGEARNEIWTRIQGSGSGDQQNDRIDVVVRGTNDRVYQKYFDRDGGGWSGFGNLEGDAAGDPTICSWGEERLDIFVRRSTGKLYHKWWNGSSWSPSGSTWEDLGGSLASDPDAISWGPGRIDVFAFDTTGDLVQARYISGGTGWSWYNHGPANAKAGSHPSVSSWTTNRIDVFIQGSDNALKHKWWNGSWSGWENLGGVLTSSPDAVSWGSGRIDVFVRGGGNNIYHKWYNSGGGWSGYENLGGNAAGAPAACSWGEDRLDIFYRGTNDALYHGWWNGSEWSSGYENLGGIITADPDAVSWNLNG